VILCSGTFDGLHEGHLGYLHGAVYLFAREVVVAIAPDAYIRQVKGREPKFPLAVRLNAVKQVWGVHRVLVHGPESALDVLADTKERWTAYVKGMDWLGKIPPDMQEVCKLRKIALAFVESGSDRHTSQS
jgi:cytidyltransferase-like protein